MPARRRALGRRPPRRFDDLAVEPMHDVARVAHGATTPRHSVTTKSSSPLKQVTHALGVVHGADIHDFVMLLGREQAHIRQCFHPLFNVWLMDEQNARSTDDFLSSFEAAIANAKALAHMGNA